MRLRLYWFEYHLNLHYSQTCVLCLFIAFLFEYHLNLHYSQTAYAYHDKDTRFEYHLNLHYSQTQHQEHQTIYEFEYHLNLHYSQTSNFKGKAHRTTIRRKIQTVRQAFGTFFGQRKLFPALSV